MPAACRRRGGDARRRATRCTRRRFDVTDEAAVAAAFDAARRTTGLAVDILVNNAGIQFRKPMVELATADWQRVIDTNLTSAFLVGREAARRMIPRGRGKIINIGSLTSELARATVAPYTVAKGGIKMLTRAMAAEWAAHGIQANAIGPGYILTDMNQALVDNAAVRRLGQGPHSRAALGQAGGADRHRRLPRLAGIGLRQRPDHLCRRRHAGGALSARPIPKQSGRGSLSSHVEPDRAHSLQPSPEPLRVVVADAKFSFRTSSCS